MKPELIKYKAKAVDTLYGGKMLEGYYFKNWEDHFIAWGITNGKANLIKVDPNTICVYTGIKDVYEGDYFWHLIEEGLVGVVTWNEDEYQWIVNIVPNTVSGKCVPDHGNIVETWDLWEFEEIEIIGNIHDSK